MPFENGVNNGPLTYTHILLRTRSTDPIFANCPYRESQRGQHYCKHAECRQGQRLVRQKTRFFVAILLKLALSPAHEAGTIVSSSHLVANILFLTIVREIATTCASSCCLVRPEPLLHNSALKPLDDPNPTLLGSPPFIFAIYSIWWLYSVVGAGSDLIGNYMHKHTIN